MPHGRDTRGLDEAVRDSDDDHARYHQADVGSRSTENRHAGQTDQDQSKPADRRTPEEDRVRLAGAIDQTGDVAARSNDTDAVEHDDLTDLLLLEALPSEKQRQREGDDAGQYGFRRDANEKHGFQEVAAAHHCAHIPREDPERGADAGIGLRT